VALLLTVAGGLAAMGPERAAAQAWHRPGADASWLDVLNAYRALAALPAVVEDPAQSSDCAMHAAYIVRTGNLTHAEDPASPYYTAAGDRAAHESNLGAGTGDPTIQRSNVELFTGSAFHALGAFNPRLTTSGYGEYSQVPAPARLTYAHCLNVLRGKSGTPPDGVYPVRFPAKDGVQPFLAVPLGLEWPNPLASCGYTGVAGGVVLLQVSATVTSGTAGTLTRESDGAALESCVYDGTSYTNPDATQQGLARRILAGYNAVVLIPRLPLTAGTAYHVRLSVNGTAYEWSFTTAPASEAAP
jgi:hypothetical protein